MLEHYAGIATFGYRTTERVKVCLMNWEACIAARDSRRVMLAMTLSKLSLIGQESLIFVNWARVADFFQPTPCRNLQNGFKRRFAPWWKWFIGVITVIRRELEWERSNVTKCMKNDGLFWDLVFHKVHFFTLTELFKSETIRIDSIVEPQSRKVFMKLWNGRKWDGRGIHWERFEGKRGKLQSPVT